MVYFKIFILNLFWFASVYYGKYFPIEFFFLAWVFVIANYIYCKVEKNFHLYLFIAVIFSLYGFVQDFLLLKGGLVEYSDGRVPAWLNALYVIFICYYKDVFVFFKRWNVWVQSLIGAIGGTMAYMGGIKLSGLEIAGQQYYLWVFISWAIFFPLSMKLYDLEIHEGKDMIKG